MTAAGQACSVLDASALVEMLLRTDKGQWFRKRLDWAQEFHAPELLVVEAAAVLRRYELRDVISVARADEAFGRMTAMPISLTATTALLPDAWTLRHHITVSDACYVVLARRLDATLITGDKRLGRAHQLGVPTLSPPDDV